VSVWINLHILGGTIKSRGCPKVVPGVVWGYTVKELNKVGRDFNQRGGFGGVYLHFKAECGWDTDQISGGKSGVQRRIVVVGRGGGKAIGGVRLNAEERCESDSRFCDSSRRGLKDCRTDGIKGKTK